MKSLDEKLWTFCKYSVAAGLALFGYSMLPGTAYAGEPAQAPQAQEAKNEEKKKPKMYRLFFDKEGKMQMVPLSEPLPEKKEKPEPQPEVIPPKPRVTRNEYGEVGGRKRAAGEKPAHEYSAKVSIEKNENDQGDTETVREEVLVRNLKDRERLRYEAGLEFVQASNALKNESAAKGSVYRTFERHGIGVEAKLGNKEVSGAVSGHVDSPGKNVRYSGYVGGGRRQDGTKEETYDLETKTETEHVKVGGSVKVKIADNAELTTGASYYGADTDVKVDGTALGQTIRMRDNIDTKVYSAYSILSLKNTNEASSLKGGHIGVIFTANENSTSEKTNKDVVVVGGTNHQLAKRVNMLITGKVGADQYGAGTKFIFGPEVDRLAGLYQKLSAIADAESEDYKQVMKEIDLVQRGLNTQIIGLSATRNSEADTTKLSADYTQKFASGFNWGAGVSRTVGSLKVYELMGKVGYERDEFFAQLMGALTKGDYDGKKVELVIGFKD
ncbi:hypothetical protein KY311_01235 [Candidatus Woesearchaeota archaeon]|nr:hypothetical protein [Candidatus Woesearchaeota archaeon]